MLPAPAFARLNLIVEFLPGGALISSRMNGFSVSKAGLTDTISSSAGFAPSERIGVGVETPSGSLDLTVGGGLLLTDGLWGSFYTGDAAWRFKLGKTAALAPHIGVVGLLPRWLGLSHSGSRDVSVANGVGALPGLGFSVGRMIGFRASADYLLMSPLKVGTANGWTADRSRLDLSGFMLQVGVVCRFFQSGSR